MIYSDADLTAIIQQQKKRWFILLLPCAALSIVLIASLFVRLQWLTIASTILIGVLLIAGYDLFIKPLHCYEIHLNDCLHGHARECKLPFIRLSENIDLVDGVQYRQLICADIDGKGRPYERLFYFDALKPFPDVQEGEMLHIVHHDLSVADIQLA